MFASDEDPCLAVRQANNPVWGSGDKPTNTKTIEFKSTT